MPFGNEFVLFSKLLESESLATTHSLSAIKSAWWLPDDYRVSKLLESESLATIHSLSAVKSAWWLLDDCHVHISVGCSSQKAPWYGSPPICSSQHDSWWLVVSIYKTQSYHGKQAIRVMADENAQPSSSSNGNNPLRLGNRKKPWLASIVFDILSDFYSCLSDIRHSSDPLVHHGRHFGRTVYAMCNVRSLVTNSLLRLEELDGDEISEESLASE